MTGSFSLRTASSNSTTRYTSGNRRTQLHEVTSSEHADSGNLSPYHNSIQPFSGGEISSGGSFVVGSSGLFSATVASWFGVVGSRPVFRLFLFCCDALRRASRRFSVVAGATGVLLFSWAWACSCCNCTSESLSGSVSLHVVVWMWRFWLDEGEHPSARLPSPSSPASYLNGCRPPV